MDYELLLEIAVSIGLILLGGLSLYFKTKVELQNMATELIYRAEDEFKSLTNAGGEKFDWVVNNLYDNLPPCMKTLFKKEDIERMVQSLFDNMKSYAVLQLDSMVDKLDEKYNSQAD